MFVCGYCVWVLSEFLIGGYLCLIIVKVMVNVCLSFIEFIEISVVWCEYVVLWIFIVVGEIDVVFVILFYD